MKQDTLMKDYKQRGSYKVPTKRKQSDAVADNLWKQNFNPLAVNEVCAGDITYLRTAEGWRCQPRTGW